MVSEVKGRLEFTALKEHQVLISFKFFLFSQNFYNDRYIEAKVSNRKIASDPKQVADDGG